MLNKRNKESIIWLVLLLLSLANCTQDESGRRLNSAYERSYDSLSIIENRRIDLPADIIRPMNVKVMHSNIFVLDFETMIVSRFDREWNRQNTIGNGIGRGPGEAELIADIYVDSKYVWMLDQQLSKVMKFTHEGELVDELLVAPFSVRMIAGSDGFIVHQLGMEELFTSYTGETDSLIRFGKPEGFSPQRALLYTGELAGTGDDSFYFLPRNFSMLYQFSASKPENFIEIALPDGQTLAEVTKGQSETDLSKVPSPRIRNYALSISDNIAYILSYDKGIKKGDEYLEKWKLHIDTFDFDSGTYLRSYKFPGFFLDFTVSGDTIYSIDSDVGERSVYETVVKW